MNFWAPAMPWSPVGSGAFASTNSMPSFLQTFRMIVRRPARISIDMWRGVAMPEEQIVLDNIERWQAAASPEERVPERQDDTYAGPGIDPLRGLQKAGWRLYVFYGPFAPLVLVGLVLLIRGLDGDLRRFAAAWALTYLLLNLASGGLPGPNLVRQHKDIEVVSSNQHGGATTESAYRNSENAVTFIRPPIPI